MTSIFKNAGELNIEDFKIDEVLKMENSILKTKLLNSISEFCDFTSECFQNRLQEILQSSHYIQLLYFTRNENQEKIDEIFPEYFSEMQKQHNEETFQKIFHQDCQKIFDLAFELELEQTLAKILSYLDFRIYEIETKGLYNVVEIICMNGYFKLLDSLVGRQDFKLRLNTKSSKIKTVLDLCMRGYFWRMNNAPTKLSQSYNQSIELILDAPGFIQSLNEDEDYNPIRTALMFHCDYAAYKLLDKGYHMNAEEFKLIDPQIFERFLNSRVKYYEGTNAIEIDYSFLKRPTGSSKKKIKSENEDSKSNTSTFAFFQLITENSQIKHLLNHPILALRLNIQNTKLTYYYYLSLLMCLLFLVLPIIKISISKHLNEFQNNFDGNAILVVAIYCTTSVLIKFRVKMFDYMNLMLSLLSWMYYFGFVLKAVWIGENSENPILSLLIIFATFELIDQMGMVSVPFSVNVLMCKVVGIAFMKLFLVFAIILVGFGFSFFMIVNTGEVNSTKEGNTTDSDDDVLASFSEFDKIIVKIVVMFTGEFDAASFKYKSWGINVVLILFVISQIVIFNLTNALVVDDIEVTHEVERKSWL